MGYQETFMLNRDQILTTVTSDAKDIENHLSSFLHPWHNHQTKIIGFDVEWFMDSVYYDPKCATIHMCDGKSCLIIEQHKLPTNVSSRDNSRRSLVNFFSLPNITFVGVGIKENMAKLEKHYMIRCRNAVELGPLAATIMDLPRLCLCGVDELAYMVNGFDLRYHRPFTVSYDYADSVLSKELAKLATVNVYSYHKIGHKLLSWGT